MMFRTPVTVALSVMLAAGRQPAFRTTGEVRGGKTKCMSKKGTG